MSALAMEPALAAELWVSLVSLVRSYAGVAGLNGGAAVEVCVAETSVSLSAGAVECTMRFEPESSTVIWTLREAEHEAAAGRFELRPDGRIEQEGKAQEMDSVAIDMAARVRDQVRDRARREARP
ncbi:MAG TPA: hypothetical protein VHU89_06495 [Acidobacteriaceae bacterium]|jgi:hypothetical protein|nr:hypothetical protein [Acidobacteriaceae bacterium]